MSAIENVTAAAEIESKNLEVSGTNAKVSENISEPFEISPNIETRLKESNSSEDKTRKNYIAELIRLGSTATTLAHWLYDSADNTAISKLYTEMRRLDFTDEDISQISSNGLSLKRGAIYEKNSAIGIWDGKNAYTLNSAGKLAKSSSYTRQVKQALAIGQTRSSKVSLTAGSKIFKFVNNVASNKVVNSAVNSLSRLYTKTNKGSLALKLLAADISTNNLGSKKFSGKNAYISSNAISSVLNWEVSKRYIARKNIKANTLKTALAKGKAILRVKGSDNKLHFIAISKVSNKKVTVYDNKKSEKVAVNSLTSYLNRKKFRFSGVAITYNVKIGKSPSVNNLKSAIGI
ncbi:MAG: hypothetical protein FWH29_00455 [Methanobrevibacter sp.]|nr:hypothetical protein [Methanobrevibacter sp.]